MHCISNDAYVISDPNDIFPTPHNAPSGFD